MVYLQYCDITWCIVKIILNKDDGSNLIQKVEKINFKRVIWNRHEIFFIYEHKWWAFLQNIVWHNNVYVPQFSQEWGPHFLLPFQNNYHYKQASTEITSEHQLLLGVMTQDVGLKSKF